MWVPYASIYPKYINSNFWDFWDFWDFFEIESAGRRGFKSQIHLEKSQKSPGTFLRFSKKVRLLRFFFLYGERVIKKMTGDI